jgi:hypothetical protein
MGKAHLTVYVPFCQWVFGVAEDLCCDKKLMRAALLFNFFNFKCDRHCIIGTLVFVWFALLLGCVRMVWLTTR